MTPVRRFVLTLLILPVLLGQALLLPQTQPSSQRSATSASKDTNTKPNSAVCTNNGTYINSRGQSVPRPENCSSAPKGATAQCGDGTYSFSRSRRGTCSHHGGVAKWLQ